MCRQFVSIGACKHHRFTGRYEKCLEAISNMGICSGAINATELIDRAHIILDERINLCEPCEFFYNQGLLLAKDVIDLQGYASREAKSEAEENGRKMRAQELEFLVLKDARAKRQAELAAGKMEGKAPLTAKQLVKRFPDPKHHTRPTKSRTGKKVHFGTDQPRNLPVFGAYVRDVEEVGEMEDHKMRGVQLQEKQDISMLEEAEEVSDMEEIGAQEFEKAVEQARPAALITKKRSRKCNHTLMAGAYGVIETVEDIDEDEEVVGVPQTRVCFLKHGKNPPHLERTQKPQADSQRRRFL